MDLITFDCKNCGAPIQLPANAIMAVCQHCKGQHKIAYGAGIMTADLVAKVSEHSDRIGNIERYSRLDTFDRDLQSLLKITDELEYRANRIGDDDTSETPSEMKSFLEALSVLDDSTFLSRNYFKGKQITDVFESAFKTNHELSKPGGLTGLFKKRKSNALIFRETAFAVIAKLRQDLTEESENVHQEKKLTDKIEINIGDRFIGNNREILSKYNIKSLGSAAAVEVTNIGDLYNEAKLVRRIKFAEDEIKTGITIKRDDILSGNWHYITGFHPGERYVLVDEICGIPERTEVETVENEEHAILECMIGAVFFKVVADGRDRGVDGKPLYFTYTNYCNSKVIPKDLNERHIASRTNDPLWIEVINSLAAKG